MVGGRIQDDKISATGYRVRLFHRHRDQGISTLVTHHPEVRTGFGHAAAGKLARYVWCDEHIFTRHTLI